MKKRTIVFWAILLAVCIVVGLTCSCMNSKSEAVAEAESASNAVAEAESSSEAESSVEIGNATAESSNELTSDLTSSVKIKGVELEVVNEAPPAPEPEFTFAQLFWLVYQDRFAKTIVVIVVTELLVVLNVLLFGLLTGNLGITQKFSLKSK